MPGDEEVSLDTVYAEVDKRITAAIDKLKTELLEALKAKADKPPEKKGFKITNRSAS